MTDEEHAQAIRAAAQQLYDVCAAAHKDGLVVNMPLAYPLFLIKGTGPGGPADWVIKRKSL